MPDKRPTSARSLPKRFSTLARTMDKRRAAELSRGRGGRLAKLRVPPEKVQDLKTPWLRLTPLHPAVDGKGRVDFWNPSFVGFNTIELAAFDAAFEKQIPDVWELVRGAVGLSFESTAAKSLVEITVFAHVEGSSKPRFEVWADNGKQIHEVADAKSDVITVVASSSVWLQLEVPGQTDDNLKGDGGGWAFYELQVTPLD